MGKSWKVKIRYVNTDLRKDRIIIGIPETEENIEMIREIFGKEVEINLK